MWPNQKTVLHLLNTNIHVGIVMPLKEKETNPMDLPVVGRVDLPLYGNMQGKMTAGSVTCIIRCMYSIFTNLYLSI